MRNFVASFLVFAMRVGVLLLVAESAATAQAVAQPEAPRRYTHHRANAGAPRTVVLSLEGPFTPDERAKVLRATEEWNHALNGFIRFDVVAPGLGGLQAWSIRAEKGGTPKAPDPAAGQPLSFTQAGLFSIGGRMVIYVDHIGTRDLRGVVLHELGHVLGLNHDPSGNLMSVRYAPTIEQCIDRPTAELIAARHSGSARPCEWPEFGQQADHHAKWDQLGSEQSKRNAESARALV